MRSIDPPAKGGGGGFVVKLSVPREDALNGIQIEDAGLWCDSCCWEAVETRYVPFEFLATRIHFQLITESVLRPREPPEVAERSTCMSFLPRIITSGELALNGEVGWSEKHPM